MGVLCEAAVDAMGDIKYFTYHLSQLHPEPFFVNPISKQVDSGPLHICLSEIIGLSILVIVILFGDY